MRMLKTLFAGMLLLSGTFANAQTVDDVINKHITAIGGKDVITKIKSQVMESDLSIMGSTFPNTTTVVAGKGFKNVTNIQGTEIVQCITPTSGWMINPMAGMTEPQPMPESQVKEGQSSFDMGGELFNYQEKGNKVELAGNQNVDGVNAIKLKVVNKAGNTSYFFLDPTTYYILRTEATTNVNGQDVTGVTTFSNYKKTDVGFVMPFTMTVNQGMEFTININKVEFNKDIDPKIFEMPK